MLSIDQFDVMAGSGLPSAPKGMQSHSGAAQCAQAAPGAKFGGNSGPGHTPYARRRARSNFSPRAGQGTNMDPGADV